MTNNTKIVIALFVIDIFANLLAPFSKYYISNIEVYLDIMCFFTVLTNKNILISTKNIDIALKYFVACGLIIFIPIICFGNLPFTTAISRLLFAISFILLKTEIKKRIYILFVKYFVILLTLGIIEWVLLFFGTNFFWSSVYREGTQEFKQGLFILVPSYYIFGNYRFMSLCTEPGGLGTICFFLLATLDSNKYKKQYIIILFAGLISFSLGFYVLIVLWFLTQFKKIKISQILVGVVVVTIMLNFFGDFFNARIVERLINVDSVEELDNRSNEAVDEKLEEISNDYRFLVGMGNRNFYKWKAESDGVSAGVKNFLLQYGVLGLIIYFVSFSRLIIRIRGFNKQTLILVAFVWLCFYKSSIWNSPPVLLPLLTVLYTTPVYQYKLLSKTCEYESNKTS